MPIITVEIMNIIDERETHTHIHTHTHTHTHTQTHKTKIEKKKGAEAIMKGWELNDFCCTLGFLQLICKASLIFKSNFELASSIIVKERELYETKHVAMECRCLKIWDLLSFVKKWLFDLLTVNRLLQSLQYFGR